MRISRIVLVLAVLALASCGTGRKVVTVDIPQDAGRPLDDNPEFVSQTRLIVMYDAEVGKELLLKAIEEYGAKILYDYSIIPGIALEIPDGTDIKDAIAYFKNVKGVTSVERDRIYHLIDPVKPKLEAM